MPLVSVPAEVVRRSGAGVLPHFAEKAWLIGDRRIRTVSVTAEQPKIAAEVGPSGRIANAALRLRACADENADVIGTAVRDLGNKGESAVAGNGQVVAAIVL